MKDQQVANILTLLLFVAVIIAICGIILNGSHPHRINCAAFLDKADAHAVWKSNPTKYKRLEACDYYPYSK